MSISSCFNIINSDLCFRMIGTIFWECVCCSYTDSRRIKIRVIPSEPGSLFAAFWSFLLPSKRRIHIHTVCKECVHERGFTFPDEQLSVIWKARQQFYWDYKCPWTRQSWRFWILSAECQAINDTISQNQEISLHLSVSAFLT